MPTYIALLRGINVGGNKKVSMADLQKMFEGMGYKNIHTLLNSGNVIFDAPTTLNAKLTAMLEREFEKTFGFTSSFIIRSMTEIQALIALDPFKKMKETKDTRFYVTFLSTKANSSLKIPYTSPEKDFSILTVTAGEVWSVLDLSKGKGTVDAMGILEKEFGKSITTRNWNTVQKLATK